MREWEADGEEKSKMEFWSTAVDAGELGTLELG